MSDTTYVDYTIPAVNAAWLNEINDHVWHNTPVSGATVHSASAISFIPSGTGGISSTVQNKLREWVSSTDYTTSVDALAAAVGTVFVNTTTTVVPVSSNTKNVLWEYSQGGDSDNVLKSDGTRGGLFAEYDCKAARVLVAQITENQSATAGGGFRDLIFFNAVDSDTTNYTAIGQKVTNGLRAFVQGAHDGTSYQAQYKDLVGCYFAASGNIQWDQRGVSAVTADAYQFGTGIASNEFTVNNPSVASGGVSQSKSMAAVQAIVRARFAAEDASHISHGVLVENFGERITAAISVVSNTSDGFSSHFRDAINMEASTVSNAAIIMPASASGNVGTIIEYDANDYTSFDRTNNYYAWVVGGVIPFAVTANGISIGSATTAATRLFIEPSNSFLSSARFYPGVAPTSPQDGDFWYDGTNVKFRVGGTTKTFTLV